MKKTFFFLFFVALLLFPLYSANITGYGTGSSKEEAIQKARQDLQTSIRVNVSVSTTVSVFDDGENKENVFSSSSTSTSSGILKGLSETAVLKEDGTWKATCTISESKSYLYEDALKDTINSINNCQKEIDKGLTPKEEINYLQIQIEQFDLFDFYSDILLMLGHGSTEKPLIGKENVQSRYNIVFSQIAAPALPEIDSEKNKEEYENALALYEERKKINAGIKNKQALELQEYQEKLSNEQKKTLSSYEEKANKAYKALTNRETPSSFDSIVSSFLEARTALKSFYAENTKFLESLNKTSENLIKSTRDTIFANPYDSIAEMKNGKPTEKALAERTRVADNETKKIIDSQNELYVDALEAFQVSAKKLYSIYTPTKDKINDTFITSSTAQDTSFIVGRYDASSYSWPFAFSFTILGQPITVTGNISDSQVQSLGKESENNWRKDAEYHSLVELYDAFFHSENALVVICNYKSSAINSTGKIDIRCYSYAVTRLDNSSTVGSGNLNIKFSYEYEKENALELVLYALGKGNEESKNNAKDLFLGNSLSSLSVDTTSSEDKENFSIAKVTIQEGYVSKIQALHSSLDSEYKSLLSEVSIKSKGYAKLLEKLEEGEKVLGILNAFGETPTSSFTYNKTRHDNYYLNSIKEVYTEKIRAGVKKSDLNDVVLNFVNSFSSSTSNVSNSITELNNFFSDYENLIEKRREIQRNLSSDQITYSKEEISADYSVLEQLEEKLVSKSCEITLTPNAFVSSIEITGINLDDLKIKYVFDSEKNPNLKGLEFEIALSQIIGTAPANVEEKEAYYQKALGAIYVFTGDSIPFYLSLKLSLNTDSIERDGLLRDYIPFSYCQIECTYVIKSKVDNTIFKTESLILTEDNENPLSTLSSVVDTRDSYEIQLKAKRKEIKKQETKAFVVNFFKNAHYGLTLFFQEGSVISDLGFFRLSATKYDKHLFYGLGIGFMYPEMAGNKGNWGFGINGKFGVKTSEKADSFLDMFKLYATAGVHCSLDFIPSLYGAIPNFIAGVSGGLHFTMFELYDATFEIGYGFSLGKVSGAGIYASTTITLSTYVWDAIHEGF